MQRKWTVIDQPAVQKLTAATASPGVVYPLSTSALPSALQPIPGAVSYFVSGYTKQVHLTPGMTAGGEMVVVRTDGTSTKAYNFILATSSNGQVCFNGPHKNFPGHHFDPGVAVTVASLFGHGPVKQP